MKLPEVLVVLANLQENKNNMIKLIAKLLILFRVHIVPKESKRKLYTKTVEYYTENRNDYYGFCLWFTLNDSDNLDVYNFMWWYYPEIYLGKPKKYYKDTTYWFTTKDGESRLKIAEKALSML